MISDQSEDRPLHAERIRRSWEARKCGAMVPVVGRWVKLGMGRGKRKKQIPRYARNDNSRALRWVVGLGFVVGRVGVEVGVIRAGRGRARVWGRAGSGSCGCC